MMPAPLTMLMPLLPCHLSTLTLLLMSMCAPRMLHAEVAVARTGMAAPSAPSLGHEKQDSPAGVTAGLPETAQPAVTPPIAASNVMKAAKGVVPQRGRETEGTGHMVAAAAAAVKEPTPVFLGASGSPSGNLPGNVVIPVLPQTGIWTDLSSTPRWLVGHCSTVWTSSVGKYKLPYRVEFGTTGFYRWWAPFANGVDEERGSGAYLSSLHTTLHHDGSWETGYFAANRLTPDATNSTNCCCEYIGQAAGAGQPRVLADYCTATVPHSSHLPFEEVCVPHIRQCPSNNNTALAEMGAPFIEIYSPCTPLAEGPSTGSSLETKLQRCLVWLVTLFAVVQLARVVWKAMRTGPPQKCDLNKALL